MDADLRIEYIPFLVDERDHNIDEIGRLKERRKQWIKTFRKSIVTRSNRVNLDQMKSDHIAVIRNIDDKISDLMIRNLQIDNLIWLKHQNQNLS